MRILILEPHATGHHASYLRWLVQAMHQKGWSVVIATTEEALVHPELSAITAKFDNILVHTMRESPELSGVAANSRQLIRREFAYWRNFKRAVRDVRADGTPIDLIIVPYIDYCFYALALLGAPFLDIPWCGISMRLSVDITRKADRAALPWKWRMARRLLGTSGLRALFVINPSIAEIPPHWHMPKETARLRYLPDPAQCVPAPSRAESRAKLGIAKDKVAILVFGSIDERKGIDSLISAVATQADLAAYLVILAGKQSSTMRRGLLASMYGNLLAQNRLIIIDRFVDDLELGMLLAASDVVWVGYRDHIYMSGVLVLAGKAGLPVVGTSEGEIGRLINRHEMGVLARIEQPVQVAIALRAMLNDGARLEMGRRARLAFEDHTVENFGATILSVIDN